MRLYSVLRIMLRLTPRIAQTLPNLRTWAPCCVICLIKSPAIRADLSRFFRVGHPIMDGFGRQTTRCSTPQRLLNSTPTSSSKSSRRATRTILIPEAAICCANSLPIPDEAPVSCVINYSFELILCSEHTIDRSAHLFQNKSRRQAIHHFELIRLTWTNFKSIGLHSFDGDFNHVFHLHDRNAFHVFKIKVTQEFGLCRRRC